MKLLILYIFPPHAQTAIYNDSGPYTSIKSFRNEYSIISNQSTQFHY